MLALVNGLGEAEVPGALSSQPRCDALTLVDAPALEFLNAVFRVEFSHYFPALAVRCAGIRWTEAMPPSNALTQCPQK